MWDPYLKQDVEKLERVQKQAAHFITGEWHPDGALDFFLEKLILMQRVDHALLSGGLTTWTGSQRSR